MARYTVLRLLIFFGFLCAIWLLGLREESQRWWLLGLSAVGSMVASYFVLKGPRAEFSTKIARHVDARLSRALLARRSEADDTDETHEDLEVDEGPERA
jgi:Protein of unknown function (DUF4229)